MSEAGGYRDCYVAFLDILAFKTLVECSIADGALLQRLSGITTLAASPRSGMKQTSLGPCPMQVRAFSDCIVVFTPITPHEGNASNPLAQLCFVVRYLHDRILDLDTCFRGGITAGKMYWHPSWSEGGSKPKRGSRGALPITFGPAMNAAYHLENKLAVYPRVLIDDSVLDRMHGLGAWPLVNNGMRLDDACRTDPVDGRVHLDFLNPGIERKAAEQMHSSTDGFTVTWDPGENSTHRKVLARARQVASKEIQAAAEEMHREKWEWLMSYADIYHD